MEEMDVDEVNYNEDSIEDESARQLGVDGDPEAHPGIGDEYQVEIPPIMTKSDYFSLTNSSTDAEVLGSEFLKFFVGLPISLVWIDEKAKNIKREPEEFVGVATVLAEKDEPPHESGCTRTKHIFTEGDELKPKVDTNIMSGGCAEFRGPNDFFLRQDVKAEMLQNIGDKGYSLVPGSLNDTWSNREEASFLLGLYIFGKDLVQVKKFVETKSMGDILSFYYEKFYRSDKYRRWAGCRKISSSRRCIFGHKIFTGPRQQELSSRLLPRLSEKCQNTLEEVSKMFVEGKMSLEEYVVSLKAAVGLNALIEAVGIGNGKQDLTGISEPPKSNQVGPARPEVPVGKACSFLTPLEIINFLTGDYRLSKARSNDLFWEAVWPRLLARGWHSEQPNDNGCAAISKHSLVFLVPGIKKFSRRKLIKGNHYFDSVTDVLTKVASDPTLLELEIGGDKSYSSKGENGWTNGTNSGQDNSPDQHRHCYLKPRTPNRGTEVVKFTVVDTSLAAYGEAFKVREMRSLPVELVKISSSRSQSAGDDKNSSESADETDSADSSSFDRDMNSISNSIKANFEKGISSERIRFEHTAPKRKNPVNGSDSINISKPSRSHNRSPRNEIQEGKAIKGQSRQTMKLDNMIVPITKRRRGLTACNRKERNPIAVIALAAPTLKQQKPGFLASKPNLGENILPQVDPCGERLSSTPSKRSPNDSGEGMHNGASSGGAEFTSFLTESIQNNICEGIIDGASSFAGGQHDKPKSRVLFDLNVAAVPNAETDDLSLMGMTGKHDEEGTEANERCLPDNSACMEQPSSMNSRRQSTRNRPPTARALEALAFGFLSVKPKRKSRDAFSPESSTPRPRRARAKLSVMEDSSTDLINEERGKGMCNSNGDRAKSSVMEDSSTDVINKERGKGICNSNCDVLSEVQFESMETKLT
ncbi:hypothetical protein HS088_TW13G01613 [Tripterygium wilfordii]|uniref:SANT domain-containing protein n=1 Tax=Tripterygium wilfordii TaxID=458696 RepID=A0A7J7CX50_TRIWF|nr:uncharacterized protein LOC120013390 [Tripterygium wilfordii]KAF5738712.1 hypothetical protein HS088_TW13G01613 [Tripterygium wilfordii]